MLKLNEEFRKQVDCWKMFSLGQLSSHYHYSLETNSCCFLAGRCNSTNIHKCTNSSPPPPNSCFQVYKETPVKGFKTDEYETKQIFFSSKDGVRVPMFVTCKKVRCQTLTQSVCYVQVCWRTFINNSVDTDISPNPCLLLNSLTPTPQCRG